jgi:hypothetical protein
MTLPVALLKRLIWYIGVPLAALLLTVGLQSIASLYGYFERARVIDSALHILEPRRADGIRLSYLPDAKNLPRPMEPFTREAITNDYLLSFEELTYSLLSGDRQGLKSYFQEAALADMLLVSSALPAEFIDWGHTLKLTFYAPDGGTVAFTDTFRYAQGVIQGNDLTDLRIAERTIDVIFQLDDGNWRIHHWRVLEDTPLTFPAPGFPELAFSVANIRGVNYIPRSARLNNFWTHFNPAEIEADFATTRSLGLNTVRFFIPYPAPEHLEKNLATVLELAQRHA